MSGGVTASSLMTAVAASAVGSLAMNTLFAKDTPTAPPAAAPTVEKPAVMPTPGDANTRNAKNASIAEQMRRRGRASTILTDNGATSDPLGG